MGIFAELAAKLARAGLPLKQAENVPAQMAEADTAGRDLSGTESGVLIQHLAAARHWVVIIKQDPIHVSQQIGVVVGRPPHHDAIYRTQMVSRFGEFGDATVEDDFQIRKIPLYPIDMVMAEGGMSRFCFGLKPFNQALRA